MKSMFSFCLLFALAEFLRRPLLLNESGHFAVLGYDFFILGILIGIPTWRQGLTKSLPPVRELSMMLFGNIIELVTIGIGLWLMMDGAPISTTGLITTVFLVLTHTYLSNQKKGFLGNLSVFLYVGGSLFALITTGNSEFRNAWLLLSAIAGSIGALRLVIGQKALNQSTSEGYTSVLAGTKVAIGLVVFLLGLVCFDEHLPTNYWWLGPLTFLPIAWGARLNIRHMKNYDPHRVLYLVAMNGILKTGALLTDLVFVPKEVTALTILAVFLAGLATLTVSREKKLFNKLN